MANHQHLDLLKRSIKDWNDWRQQNPEKQPDLSYAELQEVKLVTTYGEANLSTDPFGSLEAYGANLSHANLYKANLVGVSLIKINLSSANLHGANLRGADFRGADLSEADLSEADLYGTNLKNANLRSCLKRS